MTTDLPLTPEDVAEVVAILSGGNYDRLEIRTARFSLKVARAQTSEGEAWTQSWDWADTDAPAVTVEGGRAELTDTADGAVPVVTPLPGTFYRAPQPGTPPFIELGDRVNAETVVGIVETMKLMNPVHAGAHGVVEAILAANGAMIDGATVLMLIRPDPS